MNEFLDSSPEPRAKMPDIINHGQNVPMIEDKRSGVQVSVNPITGQTRHFKGLSSAASGGSPRGNEDRHSLVEFAPLDVGSKLNDSQEVIIKANKGINRTYGARSRMASQHGSIA